MDRGISGALPNTYGGRGTTTGRSVLTNPGTGIPGSYGGSMSKGSAKLPTMPNLSSLFGGGGSNVLPGSGGSSGGVAGHNMYPAYTPGQQGQGQQGQQFNYNAPPMNLQAQRDPQLQAMYEQYGTQRSQLAAGNDRDAINAMQRQRDLASGGMNEAASGAARRGLGANTGVSQFLQNQQSMQGQRNASGLNAAMTSDARSQQLSALAGQTGAAQASTSALQGQQNYALDQWKAQQSAAQAQAQLQALQSQNAWSNQMGMLNWYSGMMGNLM